MSTPPSPPSPPPNKPRKKRPADVVSFEDLIAAHKTEREPGQLPPEGVVLIGVDFELQRRMAEGLGFPAPENIGAPKSEAPRNLGAPSNDGPQRNVLTEEGHAEPQPGAPKLRAPYLGAPDPGAGSGAPTSGSPTVLGEEPGDALNSAAPHAGAPNNDDPQRNVLTPHGHAELQSDAPKLTAPYLGAPDPGAASSGAPVFAVRDLLIRHRGAKTHAIRPVIRSEDAFTSAERELLRWLWEKGRPVPGTTRIRLATGPNGEGARRLAGQAGLIYNTFKNLTRSLATKFALDIVKPERNLPAIYVVYDSPAILERQRQSGFTGVIHKNGGGRELVDLQAQPARRRPDLTVKELEEIFAAPHFGSHNRGA